ncbi:hypothetical protein BHM03_00036809 [Ensete ventricosum]|nr:hypothetical protein BHM03_00036809 [Ensete ventricosum]
MNATMSMLSMVEAKLPPGFRFHPRDDELVFDYLAAKAAGGSTESSSVMMVDVDLNRCEPWDLPANRATMSGYWKATGKDKPVTRKGLLVGMRKTLVFYQGRAPKGKKTKWVMHEFRMEGSDGAPKTVTLTSWCMQQDWVLCRVFCNNRRISTKPSMEASHENSGSQSFSALMDNCITFGQTPFYSEGFEQVPCFSSLSPSYVSQSQDFVLTKCLAQTGGLPELNSGLNQITGDRRDSRTVLNYLTKFEGDPKGKVVPQGGFEGYLTQSCLPSTWNP